MDNNKQQIPDKDISADQNETSAKIRDEIVRYAASPKLPCAIAFAIADTLRVTPEEIGKMADETGVKLSLCQLGLFGYYPEKKIVKPESPCDNKIRTAIQESLVHGRLECRRAWELASEFNISKLTVSGICEQEGVKITACQLGAF